MCNKIKVLIAIVLLVSIWGILELGGISFTGHYFESTKFCTSCHVMRYVYEELQESPHSGAMCGDCHIPNSFVGGFSAHSMVGVQSLYGWVSRDYSTKEKFEEQRPRLKDDVKKMIMKWDSITCRSCHTKPHFPGELGKNCLGCHKEVAHK